MDGLRTTIDFALVVLIWLVQLIIYPSFKHISYESFLAWHGTYSRLISIIVIPLMFAQVGIVGYQLLHVSHWTVWGSAFFILLAWLSTFFQAVPLHEVLGNGHDIEANVIRLIHINWNRTVLWTLVFVFGLFHRFTEST